MFWVWISKLQALNSMDIEYVVITSESREYMP